MKLFSMYLYVIGAYEYVLVLCFAGWATGPFLLLLLCTLTVVLLNTGSLTTFGCVEWESELFRGVMHVR